MKLEQESGLSTIKSSKTYLPISAIYPRLLTAPGLRYNIPENVSSLIRRLLLKLLNYADVRSNKKNFFILDENEHIISRYLDVVSFLKKKGLIKNISVRNNRRNDAPWFYICDISSIFSEKSTDGRLVNGGGHGIGRNIEIVLSKAIGEFLERYILTIYRKNKLIYGSQKYMQSRGYSILDLNALAGFSKGQQQADPKRIWNEDKIFAWEKTKLLSTGKKVYVPAQLIYWNYNFKQESFLRETNTNGGGGFFTEEEAILSGLYELIQRDGFLIYWLNGISPQRINPESVPDEEFQKIYQESRRYGFDVFCMNTTTDVGIPSATVVLSNLSGESPRYLFGGGCELNFSNALKQALYEAWALYLWLADTKVYSLQDSYKPFSDVTIGRNERLKLCCNPAMEKYYTFFMQGKQRNYEDLNFSYPDKLSKKEELDYIIQKVENLGDGYEVYAYLATHSLLNKVGYKVARVIVPQMTPLYLRENGVTLGAKRIYEVPKKLGIKSTNKLNTTPHPFP